MEVNGLPLPARLEEIVREAQGQWTTWAAKEQTDSYGTYFAGYDPEIYNLTTMAEVTAALPERCPPGSEEILQLFAGEPGVIPYITDFSRIVAFAQLEGGETFCLDYRENERDPEVILYEGLHWRQVAPSFAAFMELLEPSDSGPRRKPEAVNGFSLPGVVNGLPLPAALVQVVRDAQGEWAQWIMKEHIMKALVDAYGHHFDCPSIEIFNLDSMIEETAELPQRLHPYDELEPPGDIEIPGFIPDVKDFSKIVVFGKTGSGEPFCLDYRETLQEPTVIFCEDGYWRRVAPSFAAFIEMFEPFDDDAYDQRMAEMDY